MYMYYRRHTLACAEVFLDSTFVCSHTDVTNSVHILLSLCMICANQTCSILVKPVFMCAAI